VGRAHSVTLSAILQAAWALLLSSYTGSHDVVFGTVVSGRSVPFPGVGGIVGPFLNVLPMRVRIAPAEHAITWLRRVQDIQVAISQYEYCPLNRVQSWSDMPTGTHLFGTMVDLVNYTVRAFSTELGEGLRNTSHRSVENVGMPISVLGYPGAHLRLELSYNQRLIEPATISQALARLSKLLSLIADSPYARVSHLLELASATAKRPASVA